MKFQECNPDDPMKLIMSLNSHRRHMGESQRGAIAADLANIQHGENQHTLAGCVNLHIHDTKVSQAEAP